MFHSTVQDQTILKVHSFEHQIHIYQSMRAPVDLVEDMHCLLSLYYKRNIDDIVIQAYLFKKIRVLAP
jgi:hypothetical protein